MEPELGWRVDLHPPMRGRQLLDGNHAPFGRGTSQRTRAGARRELLHIPPPPRDAGSCRTLLSNRRRGGRRASHQGVVAGEEGSLNPRRLCGPRGLGEARAEEERLRHPRSLFAGASFETRLRRSSGRGVRSRRPLRGLLKARGARGAGQPVPLAWQAKSPGSRPARRRRQARQALGRGRGSRSSAARSPRWC